MEKIKIITDSTSDLPIDIVEKYDIEVIPLTVTVGENSYKDGVDMRLPKLLEIMADTENFPTTAQINPQMFIYNYKKYLDKGYKIISIHLSSKMSGTYQSACIAKNILGSEDIFVIDSQNVTSGLGVAVIKMGKMNNAGALAENIVSEIEKMIPHIKSYLVFESLDNLVKGGRLSKTFGIIGNILNIRPILGIENGELIVKNKVRGAKKAIRVLMEYIDKTNIKREETNVLLHIENVDIREAMSIYLKEKGIEYVLCEVGCVVGVHAGPRACGVFIIEDY